MSMRIHETQGDLLIGQCSGRLRYPDWVAAQQALAKKIEQRGPVRLLVRLEAFGGWEKSEEWGDLGFFQAHDADLKAIAIVGDPCWEDATLTFSLAGMRKAPVRYFYREAEALDWLDQMAESATT